MRPRAGCAGRLILRRRVLLEREQHKTMMKSARLLVLASIMLGAAAPGLVRATPPPPPPPCVPAGAAVTVEALGAILAGRGEYDLRRCAAKDLAARGDAAVPVLVGMLGAGDPDTLALALRALTDMGPRAQAALPALMDSIRTPPRALQENYLWESYRALYDAVSAIGAGAGPAIPLLIAKLRDPGHRYDAVGALGKLGKYDAGRVVPALVSILESPEARHTPLETGNVLGALADIGKGARAALPATLAVLERAKAAGDSLDGWSDGSSAIWALVAIAEHGESIPVLTSLLHHPVLASYAAMGLASIGPPAASAVPALIDQLKRSREERAVADNIMSALAEIAPRSPAVQQQILAEATQHGSEWAALVLSAIAPLPSHFAPALAAALAKKPGDVFLGRALENARRVK
jgi:hypothetical protein